MRRRSLVLLLVLALWPADLQADDEQPVKPPSPERAAFDVAKAFIAEDAAALKRLAERDSPDPWLVADELLYRGHADAAHAFAKAAPRITTERLPAYVASRRDHPPDEEAHSRLEATNAARAAKDWDGLLRIDAGELGTPTRIQIAFTHGYAHVLLRHPLKSAAAFTRAAEAALGLGWIARAGAAYRRAGHAAYEGGEYAIAIEAWRKQREVARTLRDKRLLAQATADVGMVLRQWGDLPGARAAHQEALGLWRELNDARNITRQASNLAALHHLVGDDQAASAAYAEVLRLARELGDPRGVAKALNDTGVVLDAQGRHAEALAHYEEALEIGRQVGDTTLIGSASGNLGMVYVTLGDSEEAAVHFEEALRLAEEEHDREAIGLCHLRLGDLRWRDGALESALVHYEKALAIARQMKVPRSIALALGNIGSALQAMKRLEEALPYLQEALAIHRRHGHRRGMATLLTRLGHICRLQARQAEAAAAYDEALTLLDGSPDPRTRTNLLWGIARLHASAREWEAAIARAVEGIEVGGEAARGLAEGEGAGVRDDFAGLFELGLRAAVSKNDTERAVWFLEQGRAGSLREVMSSRAALEEAVISPKLRSALSDARAAEHAALAAYRRVSAGGRLVEIRAARTAWEAARRGVRATTARIQREEKAAAQVVLGAVDGLATIQKRLEPSEALILYGPASGRFAALVVRRDRCRMMLLQETWRVELQAQALLASEDRGVDTTQIAALRAQLVDPLDLGEDVERVLISPAGILGYVPFALLLPDHEIAYMPSGTTHGLLEEDRPRRGKEILALGDPDYRTVATVAERVHRGAAPGRLVQLPATHDEVEAVGTVRLLGKAASESGLWRAIATKPRWRAVHLACHGLADPERPMLSSLALAADDENDGFLTGLEIFRRKIPADLVVLSACETGKGKIFRTEGIVGLTRAFMFAGTPRVLCSLWKVDDAATQALMIKFYEVWNPKDGAEGIGASAALKEAQAFVRSHEKWAHPYYWAAWVLWGLPE